MFWWRKKVGGQRKVDVDMTKVNGKLLCTVCFRETFQGSLTSLVGMSGCVASFRTMNGYNAGRNKICKKVM